MIISRRSFIAASLALAGGKSLGAICALPQSRCGVARQYHWSISTRALEKDPELLEIARQAGVSEIWLAAFFYGHWPFAQESLGQWAKRIRQLGMAAQLINIPLGHPMMNPGAQKGGSLAAEFNLNSPPDHWRLGKTESGQPYSGVSLHEPATAENEDALKRLKHLRAEKLFLDDDFRLAISPGRIGGCFCDWHRERFLRKHGWNEHQWEDLLQEIKDRRYSRLVRAWITDVCDDLTHSFRVQAAAAAPEIQLGPMIMFMGSEKAGIRLTDYAGVPVRVGEGMFDDRSFGTAKGKTDELFSALFHRRFIAPSLSWSETTAYPCDQLSAAHMAAKLVVSTLADVRHTLFMSGLDPFPKAHWERLGPEMRRQASFHKILAGHRPRGPFKHYWGERERWVGEDRPFSLFLATGVPFEVTSQPAAGGWTFLGNFDAQAVSQGQLKSRGTVFICRPEAAGAATIGRAVPESLEGLFEFKHQLRQQLASTPHLLEDAPAVCAWYPAAHSVLLWNLTAAKRTLTVTLKGRQWPVEVGPLGSELLTHSAFSRSR